MKKLIHEIHRRSLWQVLGIYVAAAWVVLQVVDVVTDNFGLPTWVAPASLVLLLVGLPIVLATAFVQEGVGPGGAREGESGSDDTGPAADGARTDAAAARPATPSRVQPGSAARASAAEPAGGAHRRLLTWRNALLGGGLAFAVLGVVTAGYLVLRVAGVGPAATLVAKGVLEARERVLVAQFESAAGEGELATAVTEALRIDLAQSPVVRLVDPGSVRDALERMGQSPEEPLRPGLAREVALRDGINAVVEGEIVSAGGGYVLTARLVGPSDGQVLVSRRETAADSSRIIGAIDRLSKGLRERIGESLGSLARTPGLEEVTTPSLKALRAYSMAERAALMDDQGDRALTLLEEAVREDSSFAMAWRKLAVIRGNRGEAPSLVYEAGERAYAHRDRLPDRDRYLTIGTYHQDRGQWEQAAAAYENLLEHDPEESFALHNLAVIYNLLRDDQRAEALYRRAYDADSVALSLHHLALTQEELGKRAEADETFARFRELFPDNPAGPRTAAYIAVGRGAYDEAEEEIRTLTRDHATSLYWRAHGQLLAAGMAALRGRVAEATGLLSDARTAQEERRLPGEVIKAACDAALVRLHVVGDKSDALAPVEAALSRYPLESLDPLDRPYLDLATVYAVAGQVARAESLMADYERLVPPERRGGWAPRDYHHPLGEIALAEGRPAEALRHFRAADYGYCRTCAFPSQGRAHELAGVPDSAIAAYRRYTDGESVWRLGTRHLPWWHYGDWLFLGPVHERLGKLYDAQGDLENAATHLARFVELWSEADEELQPRVRAAQARLEEIVRARG